MLFRAWHRLYVYAFDFLRLAPILLLRCKAFTAYFPCSARVTCFSLHWIVKWQLRQSLLGWKRNSHNKIQIKDTSWRSCSFSAASSSFSGSASSINRCSSFCLSAPWGSSGSLGTYTSKTLSGEQEKRGTTMSMDILWWFLECGSSHWGHNMTIHLSP